MPAFPIVDAHVHLWDVSRLRYSWLSRVPPLNRNHLVADYRRACGPVQVSKMVFVECGCDPSQSQAEAEWVSEIAHSEPRLRAIVAHAPVEQGDSVEPALAKLAALPLVKGVRRLIQSERDDAFCIRPDFVRGVQALHGQGFTFDLCIVHRQLPNTIKLVRQCPNVRFVLDHIGKPDIKAGRLDPWRAELKELSQLDNVWCKISGMVTEADHTTWKASDLKPYIDHVVACFGFDRVMFASDWPVSTQASEYPRWVKTLDESLSGCSADELQRVYVRNAETFYGL
jgi:L-fuconolactonase